MNISLGLYIHIPFCRQRCHFCAFYLELHREPAAEAFLNALHRELRLYADAATIARWPLQSIYFGGGTPSLLRAASLARLLGALRGAFPFAEPEITVELNPGQLEVARVPELRALGVTRLSVGVQSLDDTVLRRLGDRKSVV